MSNTNKSGQPTNPRLEELAAEIERSHNQCLKALRASLTHARDTGLALLEAKQIVEQDGAKWLPWVGKHCKFSVSQAQRYMRIADRWSELPDKTKGDKELTMVQALKILSPHGERKRDEVALFVVTAGELDSYQSSAKHVTFETDSLARRFVEKQASQLGKQILRLVNSKTACKGPDGQEVNSATAALAILHQIKQALDATLLIQVEKPKGGTPVSVAVENVPTAESESCQHCRTTELVGAAAA